MTRLVKAYIAWIVLYNILFFAYVVYFQRPVSTVVGIFPLSTVGYIFILVIIAVINDIVGWKIINAPPKNLQKQDSKGGVEIG